MVLESLRLQVLSSSVAQALVVVWREATSLQLVKPNHESLQHNHHSQHLSGQQSRHPPWNMLADNTGQAWD